MHKEHLLNSRKINKYTPPKIEVIMIELEHGLTNESTQVTPGDSGGNVNVDDWGDGGDINGSIDW